MFLVPGICELEFADLNKNKTELIDILIIDILDDPVTLRYWP